MGKEISKVVHKCASFRIELMNEQPCSWKDNVFATSSSPLSSSALHLLPTHLCGAALLIGKWLGEVCDDVLFNVSIQAYLSPCKEVIPAGWFDV